MTQIKSDFNFAEVRLGFENVRIRKPRIQILKTVSINKRSFYFDRRPQAMPHLPNPTMNNGNQINPEEAGKWLK